MKDPLAKTPADKLIIARQEWLEAVKRHNTTRAEADKAQAAVSKALEKLNIAQRVFDETYTGD